MSTNAKLFNFTVSTDFLPPAFKGLPNPLVTASDQEYRWQVLNPALDRGRVRAAVHRRRVLAPGLTFTPAYRGGSGPPLVCLHGFTGSWHIWELVLPRLERAHTVFAPTLIGHAGGPPLDVPGEPHRRR